MVDRRAAIGLTAVAATGVVAATGLAAMVVFRWPDLTGYAQDHTAFVVVAAWLVLSASALLAGLKRTLAHAG